MAGRRVAVICVMLLMLMPWPAQAAQKVNLAALNLHLRDIPAGLNQTSADLMTNTQAGGPFTGRSVDALKREGRVLTSYNLFDSPGDTPISEIDSEVILFNSPGKAIGAFKRISQERQQRNIYTRALVMHAAGNIGTGRTTWVEADTAPMPITMYTIVFYRGVYVAIVTVRGGTNTFSVDEAVHLARIVDNRIKRTL